MFAIWASDHAETVRGHDAAEISLDHVIGNKVARAYDRADMMPGALAEKWAAFLGAKYVDFNSTVWAAKKPVRNYWLFYVRTS
jgi:hypothetical protein